MTHKCPVCTADLRPAIEVRGEDAKIWIRDADTWYNTLLRSWLGFLRWIVEGKIQHGASWNGERTQYFHDPDHNAVGYDPTTSRYRYNIQIHDSPDGDIWSSGEFTVDRDGLHEIKSTEAPR